MIKIEIQRLIDMEKQIDELSDLLVQVVEDGASIGFLPPIRSEEAIRYWESVVDPTIILLVATIHNKIAGSVQIHLCSKPNGTHRAEIAKLMTHPGYRRNGMGRLLMEEAENIATKMGRSLLVLDTREGDPSNHLYTKIGFLQGGRIPNFAKSENGHLDATIIYYKNI